MTNGAAAGKHSNGKPEARRRLALDRPSRLFLGGIFLLMLTGFLYIARDFLLPISLAFLFALILGPVVRWLRRRGVPPVVSAFGLVTLVFIGIAAGTYLVSGPVTALIADAPAISQQLQQKLAVLRRPMEALTNASAQIEQLLSPDDGGAQHVVVEAPARIGSLATGAGQTVAEIGFWLILLLFLLASGDLFWEKLIKVMPTLSDKKRALRIARDVEHEVSRYLLTITLINLGLGLAVGLMFWAIGMPSPVLWGILAMLLNYVPYLGAAVVALASFAIAVVAFDTLTHALLVPVAYVLLATIEGQIITPTIVGRRHELNAVVILISIAFWGWLWGFVGALIAIPMLVAAKVLADHVDSMTGFGEFLGARAPSLAEQNEAANAEDDDTL